MKCLNTIIIFICFLLFMQCNNKKILNDSSKSENELIEESGENKKQKLIEEFEKRRFDNEKKYDSLNIIGDSTKNKSTLSGFDGLSPRYNKTH